MNTHNMMQDTYRELAEVENEIDRFCTMLRLTPIEQVDTLAWIRESLAAYHTAYENLKGRVSLLNASSISLH
ncbi:MAG: hypothetical protein [Bacteriophage sp.]|nr:MAG: hypothetical protein [Bacteriophage sp.]